MSQFVCQGKILAMDSVHTSLNSVLQKNQVVPFSWEQKIRAVIRLLIGKHWSCWSSFPVILKFSSLLSWCNTPWWHLIIIWSNLPLVWAKWRPIIWRLSSLFSLKTLQIFPWWLESWDRIPRQIQIMTSISAVARWVVGITVFCSLGLLSGNLSDALGYSDGGKLADMCLHDFSLCGLPCNPPSSIVGLFFRASMHCKFLLGLICCLETFNEEQAEIMISFSWSNASWCLYRSTLGMWFHYRIFLINWGVQE